MQRLSTWVSAGLLTAGLSAALLSGAGLAAADAGSPPTDSTSSAAAAEPSSSGSTTGATETEPSDTKPVESAPPKKKKKKKPGTGVAAAPEARPKTGSGTDGPESGSESASAKTEPKSVPDSEPAAPAITVKPTTLRLAQDPITPKAAAAPPNPIKVVARAVTNLITNIGSAAINALQALEKFVTGPPVLPAKTTVTVGSSTILLGNGQRVQANWYYPKPSGTGAPPEKMILLQHGFFALGPMYSFTAANLAERTNSVVVTPTLPSNFFAADDRWLGGSGMATNIADLFRGDRAALTESALAAGYATRYGLDPATAALPQKFALAGHSAGGGLVSGAAGSLAASDDAADLVGVILLDAVPTGNTLKDALTELDAYQGRGGQYIPVRAIGAPPNAFNFISTVNQTLSAARPGRFNGVVLAGGVHMDSMQGGNSLIQFVAQLLAGVPQAQNPPAVTDLAVAWFTDWFAGDTADGDELVPGSTIDIPTPKGTAHGRVIGTAPAAIAPTAGTTAA
ncbi:alpha/beta hydrolase family protein [Mycolicibacterium cosmeticum]|uniref:Lipocalin family protein n=1 Tax=Mycolicibacterium cosmeticum TaxID=258533 RepID=W9AYU2_MYCCO|nr:alpha/beta hydrolase [Mycolicibacterium cosmeticum]CDO07756.1 Lipocalin family protein [Mycolicibacterium cosmeticum]